MKKTMVALLCLVTCCVPLCAQVIKIENGMTLSSMTRNEYDFFTHTATGYTARVGIDWLEHRWFYLSSEVGYMATGGMDQIDRLALPTRQPALQYHIPFQVGIL